MPGVVSFDDAPAAPPVQKPVVSFDDASAPKAPVAAAKPVVSFDDTPAPPTKPINDSVAGNLLPAVGDVAKQRFNEAKKYTVENVKSGSDMLGNAAATDNPMLAVPKAVLGAVETATAPFGAVAHSFISEPAERATGGKIKAGLTDAAMALGSLGLAGAPMVAEKVMNVFKTPQEIARAASEARAAQHVQDALAVRKGEAVTRQQGAMDYIKTLPKEVKTPEARRRLTDAIEAPTKAAQARALAALTPAERAHLPDLIAKRDEVAEQFEEYTGEKLIDNETFLPSMAKGKGGMVDMFGDDAMGGGLPNLAPGARNLSKSAGPSRTYVALQNTNGERKLAAYRNGQLTILQDKKPVEKIALGGDKPVRGSSVKDDAGNRWTVRPATVQEREQHAGEKYLVDPHANLLIAQEKVARAKANRELINGVVQDLKTHGMLTTDPQIAQKRGYRATELPAFRKQHPDAPTMYLPKKVSYALDDFHNAGKGADNAWTATNRFLTSALFYNPAPHIANVASHYVVARGWDTFKDPIGAIKYNAQAFEQVSKQTKEYRDALKEGAQLFYANAKNGPYAKSVFEGLGHEMLKDSKWDKLAKSMGMSGAKDLVERYYKKMNEALWLGSDTFMMARINELREKRGLSLEEAVEEAGKHIPDYQMPSTVLGSRQVQKALTNSNLIVFSRYHYGMLKSYANMLKDIKDPEKRMDALGHIAALLATTSIAYPLLDAAAQKITGNPDASVRRSGASSIPHALGEVFRGKKDTHDAISSVVTPAPAVAKGYELWSGHDFRFGYPIDKPDDSIPMSAAKRVEKVVGDVGPLATANRLAAGKKTLSQEFWKEFLVDTPTPEEKNKRVGYQNERLGYTKRGLPKKPPKPKRPEKPNIQRGEP
jgi:hypothetical protein